MSAPQHQPSPAPPLGRRGIHALVVATGISSFGDGAFLAAAPLAAAALTRSPIAVSLVAAAEYLPWVIIAPVAGVYVDRWPRRATMIAADVIRLCAVGAAAVLIACGLVSIPLLACVAFITVAGTVFHDAAGQTIIADLTARQPERLHSANGRISAALTGGRELIGPPAGSMLYSATAWIPFAADAVSFAASAAVLTAVPKPGQHPPAENAGLWRSIREGAVFLVHHRALRTLCLLTAVGNLAYNCAWSTFVLYATGSHGLDVTDAQFGWLVAALAAGGILGGVLASRIIGILGSGMTAITGFALEALAWPAVAATTNPLIAALALIVTGFAATQATVVIMSARQRAVPGHLLGRVITAFRVVGNGTAPFGAVLGGFIASWASLRAPLIAAGALLLAALLVASLSGRLRADLDHTDLADSDR
ncbi:MAG: MFS transporter [Micromonosporaceae bacterium]|nr:MFS transporter [Micromonosporaceae bacterium]